MIFFTKLSKVSLRNFSRRFFQITLHEFPHKFLHDLFFRNFLRDCFKNQKLKIPEMSPKCPSETSQKIFHKLLHGLIRKSSMVSALKGSMNFLRSYKFSNELLEKLLQQFLKKIMIQDSLRKWSWASDIPVQIQEFLALRRYSFILSPGDYFRFFIFHQKVRQEMQ